MGMISGAAEGKADPASHVEPVWKVLHGSFFTLQEDWRRLV